MPGTEPLNWFVETFNCTIGAEECPSYITKEDVEYSWKTSAWASCGPRSGKNKVYFAINQDWWDSHSTNERCGLLIHEVSHYVSTSHDKEFYDTLAKAFNRFESNEERLKSDLSEKINISKIKNWIVDDFRQYKLDGRKLTTFDACNRFAENINYDIDIRSDIFNTLDVKVRPTTASMLLTLDEFTFDTKSMQDVSDWLRYPRKNYIDYTGSKYKVRTVKVEKNSDGSFKPIDRDGEMVLSLLKYKNPKLRCPIRIV